MNAELANELRDIAERLDQVDHECSDVSNELYLGRLRHEASDARRRLRKIALLIELQESRRLVPRE